MALCSRCGFRQVGRRNGAWHDVILMERRSNIAGNE